MEATEYQRIYEAVHERQSDYGSHHGSWATESIKEMLPTGGSFLDMGCGRMQMCADVKRVRPDAVVIGFDVVVPLVLPPDVQFIHSPMWDLSALEGQADMIGCFDALEHLYPEDVNKTLEAFHTALVPGGWFFTSISFQSSVILGPEGQNLHPTVHPFAWWVNRLDEWFDVLPCAGHLKGRKK